MKKLGLILSLPILFNSSSCEKLNNLFQTKEVSKSENEENKETLTKEEIIQLLKESEAVSRNEILKQVELLLKSYFTSSEIKDLLVEALKDTYSTQEVDHMINSLEGERVVESYRNEHNWYRVYSDNWIEQGGRSAVNQNSTKTITLHKEMVDMNFHLNVLNNTSHTAKDAEGVLTAVRLDSRQFKVTAGYLNPNTANFLWEVKGFMKVEDSEVNDV